MSEIKISIIVPVYNGEKYLRPLLDSIAAQSERSFELVAVDDGSKDSSVQILNEYKEKIPNLTVVSQPNSGVSVARNNGIAAAQGEYFCFCDADDILSPDYLSVFVNAINQYAPDVMVCGYQVFYGEKSAAERVESVPQTIDLYEMYGQRAFEALSKFGLQTQIWNKVYRTSLVRLCQIEFTPGSSYGEDMFFNWKVFLASKSMIKIDCDLYFYRMIEGSASMRYHPHLYESYKGEYQRVTAFAQQIGFDREIIQDEVCQNLIERIPALVRMAVRRKQGIRQARQDIHCIAEDMFMKDALHRILSNPPEGMKPETIQLAEKMQNKKTGALWLYGFKSELRIALGRRLKNMRRKCS